MSFGSVRLKKCPDCDIVYTMTSSTFPFIMLKCSKCGKTKCQRFGA